MGDRTGEESRERGFAFVSRRGEDAIICLSSATRRVSASSNAALRTSLAMFSATCSIVDSYTPCTGFATPAGCGRCRRKTGSSGIGCCPLWRRGECANAFSSGAAGEVTREERFEETRPPSAGALKIAAIWRSAPPGKKTDDEPPAAARCGLMTDRCVATSGLLVGE
jgi:hypothetical protein